MSSALPESIQEALLVLLQGLQSTDNTIRSAAENQLNSEWIGKRPDLLLVGLSEQMLASPDDGVSLSLL